MATAWKHSSDWLKTIAWIDSMKTSDIFGRNNSVILFKNLFIVWFLIDMNEGFSLSATYSRINLYILVLKLQFDSFSKLDSLMG